MKTKHKKPVIPEPVEEAPRKKTDKKTKKPEKVTDDGKHGVKIRVTSKLVSPDEVRENIWNYNEQSDFVFEKLKASIEEFGFTEPLTVRSANQDGKLDKYEVIGGAHRLKAARELGMKEIPINDVGKMNDASLKKFMIVLNETKGRPNNDQLSVVLNELSKDGIDMSVLPFDDAEIKSLTAMGDFDWNNTDVTTDLGGDSGGGEDKEPEEGSYWVGIEDVIDLDGLKSTDWKLDEKYAKRLKNMMLIAKISPKAPWKVIDELLAAWYKSKKMTEEPIEEIDEDEGGEDKSQEGDDD